MYLTLYCTICLHPVFSFASSVFTSSFLFLDCTFGLHNRFEIYSLRCSAFVLLIFIAPYSYLLSFSTVLHLCIQLYTAPSACTLCFHLHYHICSLTAPLFYASNLFDCSAFVHIYINCTLYLSFVICSAYSSYIVLFCICAFSFVLHPIPVVDHIC